MDSEQIDVPAGRLRRLLHMLCANIGFVAAAAVLIYCAIHAFDPPRLNWGDSESDYNVMTAGRNFATYGFIKLRFTPYLIDYSVLNLPADRALVYTHYPQLPDLMNGVERSLGLSSLTQFRLVALCFSFGSLVFFYGLVQRFWSRTTAQLALLFWTINPLFIQHADYLHHLPYLFFFGFGTLFFLDRYLRGKGSSNLTMAGVAIFFTFCSSYDYWFFVPILVLLMTVRAHKGEVAQTIRVLAILGACAAMAILLKFGTNAWALGGVSEWLRDLKFQYVERGTSDITRIDTTAAAWPTFKGRVARHFSNLFYFYLLFWLVVPVVRKHFAGRWPSLDSRRPNPLWLLLAAAPFLALFMEMWIGQAYPFLLLLPFAAIGAAAFAQVLLDAPTRVLHVVAIAFVVFGAASSIAQNIGFPLAVMSNENVAQLRRDLDRVSVPGQYIATNTTFDAFYRYYFRRNMAAVLFSTPERIASTMFLYSHSPRSMGRAGLVYVEHKNVERQLYDKGIYLILAHIHMWDAWGDPAKYRREIDQIVLLRDAILTGFAQRFGRKVAETDAYVVWVIPPVRLSQLMQP